jgi:hypothetical protein
MLATTGLTVPRQVADPFDPTGDALLKRAWDSVSELAGAEHYYLTSSRRNSSIDDLGRASRLASLRQHPDLRVIDLTEDEQEDMEILASTAYKRRMGFSIGLGTGERAVLAVAMNRDWTAGLDDGAARAAAEERRVPVMTTQDLLRTAVLQLHLTHLDAEVINSDLLAEGFYGELSLYP